MDNSILAGKYFRNFIINNQEVINLISADKILALKVDSSINDNDPVQYPFVVFNLTSLQPIYTKDFLTGNICTFSLAVVSNEHDNMLDIANAIRHSLEGHKYRDEHINIYPIKVQSISENTIDDAYVMMMIFTLEAS